MTRKRRGNPFYVVPEDLRGVIPPDKPRHADHDYFGPKVPPSWMQAAAKASLTAGYVGVLVWHYVRLDGHNLVGLTPERLKRFGVCPRTASRALDTLAEEGLIVVHRKRGRSRWVSIKDRG